MPILKTSEGRLDLEGPSEHFLFCGIKDSDLIAGFLENRARVIQEDPIWATKHGLIN